MRLGTSSPKTIVMKVITTTTTAVDTMLAVASVRPLRLHPDDPDRH